MYGDLRGTLANADVASEIYFQPIGGLSRLRKCFGGNDGSIAYTITNSNGYAIDFTLTPTAGTPVTNTSGNFTNLAAGDYTVTITYTLGASSCDIVENFTLTEPANALSANAVMIQDYTCAQQAII